jgi:acyl carrier protein
MQTRLINLYGPTEATVDVSYFDCPGHGEQIPTNIPIGKPIENICLYVLDKDMCLQPVGIPGELYIAGIGTARGYLNNPELTRDKFKIKNQYLPEGHLLLRAKSQEPRAKFYKTGDLVRWLPDGNIEFLGRMDFQVKIRGFRIELGEIENRLMKHPQVREAVVIDVETNENDKYLCAYLKITGDKNPDIDDLQAFLSGELPFYMIPNHFIHVETIPLTPSGKVDRKALQLQGIRLNTAVDFEEPRDDIEERVAAIWKEILKLDRVGINDSFFSLGGNSINLIRVNTRLKELFNHDLPITKMFEHFTIKSLSNYLKHLEKSSGDIESFVEKEIEGADAFQEKSLNIMEQTMQIIKGEKYD